jgi:hypothetical protein
MHEPFVDPDPFAPRWRELTAVPRPSYRFDPIAWGARPGDGPEDNLVCDAAELAEAGDRAGARELLMDALTADLRCLDAHAHLGNLEFDRAPARALVHYELGLRIGSLSGSSTAALTTRGELRWVSGGASGRWGRGCRRRWRRR